MSLVALIQKFGSLKNIPAAELDALGYVLVNEGDTLHLRKAGDASLHIPSRVEILSRRYDLPTAVFAGLSSQMQARLMQIPHAESYPADTDNPDEEGISPAHRRAAAERWARYVRAWATNDLERYRAEDRVYRDTLSRLRGIGLNVDVWLAGTDRWHIDVASGTAVSEKDRLHRLITETRTALTEFLRGDLVNPDSCMQELASRLRVKPDRDKVAAAIVDETALRLVVSVCIKRAEKKGALREKPHHNGLFHLRNVQERLSRRQRYDAGTYSVSLSRKNPFKDLTLGNDGGCCIGIYLDDSSEFGAGYGASTMPLYLTDPATQFVEVHSPTERVGIAMLYAGYDEKDAPTLIVNSIELNRKVELAANTLSDAIHGWILEFGRAAGFQRFVVGSTGYNTGTEYGRLAELEIERVQGVHKVQLLEMMPHSDVLDGNGWGQDCSVSPVVPLDPALFASRDGYGRIPKGFGDWSIERLFELVSGAFEVVVSPSMVETQLGLRCPPDSYGGKDIEDALGEVKRFMRRMGNTGLDVDEATIEAACIFCPTFEPGDIPLEGTLGQARSKMRKVGKNRSWRLWLVALDNLSINRNGQDLADLTDQEHPEYEEIISLLCLATRRDGVFPNSWAARVWHPNSDSESKFVEGALYVEGDRYRFTTSCKGNEQLVKTIEIGI